MSDLLNDTLSSIEIDAIGEILNISMGSSATAVSKMLDKTVNITTPKVEIKPIESIDYGNLEPAIAIKITYVEGISGNNIMVFKQSDMQMILNQLMGSTSNEDLSFEFDELSVSAACEVMNQMMGASATALSQFLSRQINISTPQAQPVDSSVPFNEMFGIESKENVVAVYFNLEIKDIMNSEFISVMPIKLAKDIVSEFIVKDKVQVNTEVKKEEAQQYNNTTIQPKSSIIENVDVQMAKFGKFEETKTEPLSEFANNNMNLIMNVPLSVTVEIGKTKRKVKEILDFTQGTIIELDKQAGAPIDVIVNGQLIAKGDVVVIDDNFGVRITEILNEKNILNNIG
ncbi:MAG: flagellar motor switch phosphatase FliY [Oscillospiraceae bacterium]